MIHEYTADLKALLAGKHTVASLAEQLKHSEDLECDIAHLLVEIDRVPNWQENILLTSFYELLKLIQRECVEQNPVTEPFSDNLNVYVCFANLFTGPGKAIDKNDARAMELLEQAVALGPHHPFALASLATHALRSENNPKRAYSLFLEAVRIDPDYSFALAHLGELLRIGPQGVASDPQAAYHYLQRAVDTDPNNSFALGSLGALLRSGAPGVVRDTKRAYSCLVKAYQLGPFNPFVLCTLAELLLTGVDGVPRDRRSAQGLLEKVLLHVPDYPLALATYGELLRIGGDGVPVNRAKAYELLDKAVHLVPNYGYALASLGEILCTGAPNVPQDLARSLACLEAAYSQNPNSTFILNSLAEALRAGSGNAIAVLQRVKGLVERSLAIDPNQPYPLAISGYVHAHIADETRDEQKAITLFTKALELDPRNYFSLIQLGQLLIHAKEVKKACELYERSLVINPNNLDVLYFLATQYCGDFPNLQRANILISHALVLQPENQTYLNIQSKILEQMLGRNPKKSFFSKVASSIAGLFKKLQSRF